MSARARRRFPLKTFVVAVILLTAGIVLAARHASLMALVFILAGLFGVLFAVFRRWSRPGDASRSGYYGG